MKRNKILIVTDSYTYGGLETHIAGEIKQFLRLGYEVHLACGRIINPDLLPIESIVVHENIPLSVDATSSDMRIAVEKLQYIVEKNKISFIHAHPFVSIICSYIVAIKTGASFAVTIHGPNNVKGVYNASYDKILLDVLRHSSVISVSEEIKSLLAAENIKSRVIPNTVQITASKRWERTSSKWLVVSRIDEPKSEGIKDFINKLPNPKIEVEIAGDGPYLDALKEWCRINHPNVSIKFIGMRNDINSLMMEYDYIVGMGRVVLEAISHQKPACLIGYDGVKGFIGIGISFNLASSTNFSGRGFKTIKKEQLNKELLSINARQIADLRGLVKKNYNEEYAWKMFEAFISTGHLVKIKYFNVLVESFYRENANILWYSTESLRAILEGDEMSGKQPFKGILNSTVLRLKSVRQRLNTIDDEEWLKYTSYSKTSLSFDDETIKKIKKIISKSKLFDEEYYLKSNDDVKQSGQNALDHFIVYGGVEGRSPSTLFDSKYYLSRNADVRELKINPLLHYLLWGRADGRDIRQQVVDTQILKKSANKKKRVDIINVNFYDWKGEVLFKGGAERYVFDLACELKGMGFKPRILQNATVHFKKTYRGIEVVGVVTGADDMRGMSLAYKEVCADSDLIIASPLDLASELKGLPVIGINHGIHWDQKKNELFSYTSSAYQDIFDSLQNVTLAVCVDTNFINWTRTYDYSLSEKLVYVPNYYDAGMFESTDKDFSKKLKIMYPRRLYEARGINITLDAFDELLNNRDDIELQLVGQTHDEQVLSDVDKLLKKHPEKVSLKEYGMEEMQAAYEQSHVCLIPTLYSEGTSLSCIEAMATNNAVISTNVGGLPNLVIDRYNGLLIEPTSKALLDAVSLLADDRELVHNLATKALDVVTSFDKKLWNQRWHKVIKEML